MRRAHFGVIIITLLVTYYVLRSGNPILCALSSDTMRCARRIRLRPGPEYRHTNMCYCGICDTGIVMSIIHVYLAIVFNKPALSVPVCGPLSDLLRVSKVQAC
jgi:hypothetical protein